MTFKQIKLLKAHSRLPEGHITSVHKVIADQLIAAGLAVAYEEPATVVNKRTALRRRIEQITKD